MGILGCFAASDAGCAGWLAGGAHTATRLATGPARRTSVRWAGPTSPEGRGAGDVEIPRDRSVAGRWARRLVCGPRCQTVRHRRIGTWSSRLEMRTLDNSNWSSTSACRRGMTRPVRLGVPERQACHVASQAGRRLGVRGVAVLGRDRSRPSGWNCSCRVGADRRDRQRRERPVNAGDASRSVPRETPPDIGTVRSGRPSGLPGVHRLDVVFSRSSSPGSVLALPWAPARAGAE